MFVLGRLMSGEEPFEREFLRKGEREWFEREWFERWRGAG